MFQTNNIYYIHFDSIDSTNSWAKNNAHALDSTQLTCITAQEQTAGKGRFLRRWLSPKGQNVYATLYFCLPQDYKYTANLGQVLSLSCCRVLEEKGFSPQIKWPNDILVSEKKIAGILTETTALEGRLGIILGVGINVDIAAELLETIDQPAISLAQLSGQVWKMEQILEPLLTAFLEDLTKLNREGFKIFHSDFENRMIFKGQKIFYQEGAKSWKGTCHSINRDGTLNLLLDSGALIKLAAGEIKVSSKKSPL